MLDDQSGRILALESTLTDVQRSLTAHDLLLRALLTHLALREPAAFQGLVEGFARTEIYRAQDITGAMTRDVAEELSAMFEEIAASLRGR